MRDKPPVPETNEEIRKEEAVLSEVERTESRTPTSIKRWLIAFIILVGVAFFTYLVARTVTKEVPQNTRSIKLICERGNADLQKVNIKNAELAALFDASIAARDPSEPPTPEQIIALFEKYKEPIPLTDCSKLD